MSLFLFLFLFNDPAARLDYNANQPIDAAVWEVVEDNDRQIHDAVVLEDLYYIDSKKTRRYRKIRIFSENGKAAADFVDHGSVVENLQGRTVLRDGTVIPFNTQADFVEVLSYKKRRDTQKSRVLVPPGLTDDCVVEISWEVDHKYGIPKGKDHKRYYIQENYFCKEVSFYVESDSDHTVIPANFSGLQKGFLGDNNTLFYATYKDVPAAMDVPFSLNSTGTGAIHLLIQQDSDYYRYFEDLYLTQLFDNKIRKDGQYKKWIKALKSEMRKGQNGGQATDAEALAYLLREFRARISSTALLTPEKKAEIDKELNQNKLKSRIKDVFRLGYGEPSDLGVLFANVVRDCGVSADLVLAQSNDAHLFDPRQRNFYDMETHLPMVGCRTPNGYAVFMPELPQFTPGYFPSWMEGARAVAIDLQAPPLHANKRVFTNVLFDVGIENRVMPIFGANNHKQVRLWHYDLAADGALSLKLEEKGTGFFNANAKASFVVLPPDERQTLLERHWGSRLRGWDIKSTEVKNADDLDGIVSEHVTATWKPEGEADTLWLAPFPGSGMPISSPSYWPKGRKEQIFLGSSRAIIDQADISTPNHQLLGNPSFHKRNVVGWVKFKVSAGPGKVMVERQVVIENNRLGPEKEKELREFISWVEEASAVSLSFTPTDGVN